MEIVKIKSRNEIKSGNVFYELNGKYYGRCWNCNKIFQVDVHRVASDIKYNTTPGDDDCFCSEECVRKFYGE